MEGITDLTSRCAIQLHDKLLFGQARVTDAKGEVKEQVSKPLKGDALSDGITTSRGNRKVEKIATRHTRVQ